jgi:predicted regulator of Ras-like GTPase activity (Roadblock/LC7/MglB family)
MPNASVAPAVQDLRRRAGAIAAALVSRDGMAPYADLPSGGYAETFAIMGATIVGAAATTAFELR